MRNYDKPPFTYEQHVDLLKKSGLIFNNSEYAVNILKQVNYYRFTAYCVPFQITRDVFIPETTFETIVSLYELDTELRDVVFRLIASIEIYIRTQMAYRLSHVGGTFAHYDRSIFHNVTQYEKWIVEIEKAAVDSNEAFIKHYKDKYNGFPRLPLWMAGEIMSLGSISKLYSYLNRDTRLLLCANFEVDHNVFGTWLHTITFLRNICAHHGRLWNRNFSIRPQLPNKHPKWQTIQYNSKKLFTTIAIMEWICHLADLPLCNVEPVYKTMQKIANMNKYFADGMGIPIGKKIEMCWETI